MKGIKCYRRSCSDFGSTLASEKLFEREKIKINQKTLRNCLMEAGDRKRAIVKNKKLEF